MAWLDSVSETGAVKPRISEQPVGGGQKGSSSSSVVFSLMCHVAPGSSYRPRGNQSLHTSGQSVRHSWRLSWPVTGMPVPWCTRVVPVTDTALQPRQPHELLLGPCGPGSMTRCKAHWYRGVRRCARIH